jgi:hypothetical protein
MCGSLQQAAGSGGAARQRRRGSPLTQPPTTRETPPHSRAVVAHHGGGPPRVLLGRRRGGHLAVDGPPVARVVAQRLFADGTAGADVGGAALQLLRARGGRGERGGGGAGWGAEVVRWLSGGGREEPHRNRDLSTRAAASSEKQCKLLCGWLGWLGSPAGTASGWCGRSAARWWGPRSRRGTRSRISFGRCAFRRAGFRCGNSGG